jgi:hypothetical protein
MVIFTSLIDRFNDIEATCVAYVLYKKHKMQKQKTNRRRWVHPLNAIAEKK